MIPYKSATKIVICKNKTNIHTAASATAAQAARLWEQRWPFLGEVSAVFGRGAFFLPRPLPRKMPLRCLWGRLPGRGPHHFIAPLPKYPNTSPKIVPYLSQNTPTPFPTSSKIPQFPKIVPYLSPNRPPHLPNRPPHLPKYPSTSP